MLSLPLPGLPLGYPGQNHTNGDHHGHHPNRPGQITDHLIHRFKVDREIQHHADGVEKGPNRQQIARDAEQYIRIVLLQRRRNPQTGSDPSHHDEQHDPNKDVEQLIPGSSSFHHCLPMQHLTPIQKAPILGA
jgi:hypothetical protein